MNNSAEAFSYRFRVGTRSAHSRTPVAANLRALMDRRAWTQTQVTKAGGPSQRHVSSVLNAKQNCSIEVLDRLGSAFGIPGWTFLVPNLPVDLLDSQDFALLVQHFVEAGPDGRDLIKRLAEREAHHNRVTSAPILPFQKGKSA